VDRLSLAAIVVLAAGGGCRERAKTMQSEAAVRELVKQLRVQAESATGLRFKRDVAVLLRTPDQIHEYVVHKFDEDLPPAELASLQAGYKLFGLLPDSLDLRRTAIDLYSEQIAGYYDPDSSALFLRTGSDLFRIRITASHELIHALQDQYVPLDSILRQRRRNDRGLAAQAILEGQATFYQIKVLMPEQRPETLPEHWFWSQREVALEQQSQMPQFATAPLWLKETLVFFPYLRGADFVGWYVRTHPHREPYGAAMPVSTEQILHPDRYTAGDQPLALAFAAPSPDTVRYEDDLGEFETGVLFSQLLGDSTADRGAAYAQGWGGDRYRVYGAHADALVWYSVWDDTAARDRFTRALTSAWAARRAGNTARRYRIDALTIDGRPGARLVDAPRTWIGWKSLPGVSIAR
jgi:hypothetical protein